MWYDGHTHIESDQRYAGSPGLWLLGLGNTISGIYCRQHAVALVFQPLAPHTFEESGESPSTQEPLPLQLQDHAVCYLHPTERKRDEPAVRALLWRDKHRPLQSGLSVELKGIPVSAEHAEAGRPDGACGP